MNRRPNRIPLIGKFSIALRLGAPVRILGDFQFPEEVFLDAVVCHSHPATRRQGVEVIKVVKVRSHRAPDAAIQRAVRAIDAWRGPPSPGSNRAWTGAAGSVTDG